MKCSNGKKGGGDVGQMSLKTSRIAHFIVKQNNLITNKIIYTLLDHFRLIMVEVLMALILRMWVLAPKSGSARMLIMNRISQISMFPV